MVGYHRCPYGVSVLAHAFEISAAHIRAPALTVLVDRPGHFPHPYTVATTSLLFTSFVPRHIAIRIVLARRSALVVFLYSYLAQ